MLPVIYGESNATQELDVATALQSIALTQQRRARNEEVKQRYTPGTALLWVLSMANKGNEEVSLRVARRDAYKQEINEMPRADRPTSKVPIV